MYFMLPAQQLMLLAQQLELLDWQLMLLAQQQKNFKGAKNFLMPRDYFSFWVIMPFALSVCFFYFVGT